MSELTPSQRATRDRVEGLIALAAPLLDVVLGVGERISRIAEPTDHQYYPIRPEARASLPSGAGDPGAAGDDEREAGAGRRS